MNEDEARREGFCERCGERARDPKHYPLKEITSADGKEELICARHPEYYDKPSSAWER